MISEPGSGSLCGAALIPDDGPAVALADRGSADAPLSAYSRFAQRLRRRYAQELRALPPGAPTRATIEAAYESLRKAGTEIGTALRITRQLVLERLIRLDCDQGASLALVTRAMTELA